MTKPIYENVLYIESEDTSQLETLINDKAMYFGFNKECNNYEDLNWEQVGENEWSLLFYSYNIIKFETIRFYKLLYPEVDFTVSYVNHLYERCGDLTFKDTLVKSEGDYNERYSNLEVIDGNYDEEYPLEFTESNYEEEYPLELSTSYHRKEYSSYESELD